MDAVQSGSQLGPYEILDRIGVGGMGEVYRARDTRLGRTVAIKVLAADLMNRSELRDRFEREAQTISQLNHPHICTLHDVGHQDGIDYLVMEFLEGQTLAARLERGPIPPAEALRIAVEIGDALDKAHRQGVVHRDLKPANVMLTKNGGKLLDFGLAKLRTSETPIAVSATALPTDPKNLTAAGTILGTLQYMSPEQLEGKDADARSDVFAFGATLYEMLTGRRAFQGKTQVSLMAAILEHDPPSLSSLLPILPTSLDNVVQVCLAKDPEERWQSMRDVVKQLQRLSQKSAEVPGVLAAPASRRERYLWIAVASAFLIATVVLVVRIAFETPPDTPLIRFEIEPPPDAAFTANIPRFSISPDGRYVVFAARAGSDKEQLWLRRLDSPESKPIPGTEGTSEELAPQSPFWSPDSRYVAWFVSSSNTAGGNSKLKKVDVQGGPVQTLCELPSNNLGGTWNSEGIILVSTQDTNGIQRLLSNGGMPEQVTTLDKAQNELAHLWPYFLPDGRHFLYQAQTAKREETAIYLASLDSNDRKILLRSDKWAQFTRPNLLLFMRGNALMAQAVNLKTFELTGEPALLAPTIDWISNGRGGFSVSDRGVLVYHAGFSQGVGARTTANRQMTWMDRTGKNNAQLGDPINSNTVSLSTDGKRVAFLESSGGTSDIWIYNVDQGLKSRLTTDPANDVDPVWSPDGSQIVFRSNREAQQPDAIYLKQSNGAVAEELLLRPEQGARISPLDWSLDGRMILFRQSKGAANDLWVLPLFGDRKPFPYLVDPFNKGNAVFSPNGRWVAYASNESGGSQLFVQSFPDPSKGKWQVSTAGGFAPRWRGDGRELYYLEAASKVIAIAVKTDGDFEAGKPTVLFEIPVVGPASPGGGPGTVYDVSPDGQRFLVSVPSGGLSSVSTPLTVTLNWTSALRH